MASTALLPAANVILGVRGVVHLDTDDVCRGVVDRVDASHAQGLVPAHRLSGQMTKCQVD
ncbi:hypothetical protein [Lapillicoccus sp.]|uniref:hypothetical protein n=1 Tax=Lapillicoccus sp. TaxID=1909287 RepID=UPI0027C66AB7|nr:hypothetical protein [Actinomycetota bacterium]